MIYFLSGALLGAVLAAIVGALAHRRTRHKISRFLAFAGHEMNTPATALRLTTLNFLEGIFGDLTADQKSWLEIMNEQTGRLSFLVGELRDFVHLEMGDDLSLRLQPSKVHEIVSEAILSIKRGLEQSDIPTENVVADNLPEVLIDPDRVIRVLSSLLFYARKFRKEGPLRFNAAADGVWVDVVCRFVIHPMTPQDLEKSLDLFYPAQLAHSPVMQSTGFGLGFARHLMQAQGADMLAQLNGGGELSLTLRLPQVEAHHGC